jgi:5-methylthioribose kinase
MIPKIGNEFDVYGFFQQHSLPIPEAASRSDAVTDGAADPLAGAPPGFRVLDADGVREYVAAEASLAARVGDAAAKAAWESKEIGDGNINYVYVVKGAKGAVVVKQGLPYIRCVGESWPLSQVRTFFLQFF